MTNTESNNETSLISECILFMIFLLVSNEILQSYLNKKKKKYPFIRFFHNTALTTLIGILAGLFLDSFGYQEGLNTIKAGFSEFFLIILLPPILFESAINMDEYYFFKNFGTIIMYAVFGTLIAAFFSSVFIYLLGFFGLKALGLRETIAFGAMISATDPVAVLAIFKEYNVNKILYILLFGESILNDAISIILFDAVVKVNKDSYSKQIWNSTLHFLKIFSLSIAIGFLIGIICAFILKQSKRDEIVEEQIERSGELAISNREIIIMIFIPWLSYLLAEGLHLSGIVSIMFCGITMARYALPNISKQGKQIVKKIYNSCAYTFENLVFIFIGIGFFGFELKFKEMGILLFIGIFLSINIARFLNVWIITFIVNKHRKKSKLKNRSKFLLWFSGFRGAMAYALAIQSSKIFNKNNEGNIILMITMIYITINIFLFGGALLPIIEKFHNENQEWQEMFDQSQNEEKKNEIEEYETSVWNKIRKFISDCDHLILSEHLIKKHNKKEDFVIPREIRSEETSLDSNEFGIKIELQEKFIDLEESKIPEKK